MKVELTDEAVNCLKFWQEHEMYGGTFSDVICQQMEECLCRDMTSATAVRRAVEFRRIKEGT